MRLDDEAKPDPKIVDDPSMTGTGTAATTGAAWGSLFDAGWPGAVVAIAVLPVVWIYRKLRRRTS